MSLKNNVLIRLLAKITLEMIAGLTATDTPTATNIQLSTANTTKTFESKWELGSKVYYTVFVQHCHVAGGLMMID